MPQSRKRHSKPTPRVSPAVSIVQAKANFSSPITRVQQKHGVVTILRRGVPVARLIPIQDETSSLHGSMRGSVTELGDIVGPTGVEWTVGDK